MKELGRFLVEAQIRISKAMPGFLTHRNCELINVCYLKPPLLWQFVIQHKELI